MSVSQPMAVGVIGAGTMGAGIALVAAQGGHQVHLLDSRDGAAAGAVEDLRRKLTALAAKGRVEPQAAEQAAARLHVAGEVRDLRNCGLVIEAVVEDLTVKLALFGDLEELVADDAILATNASSLSVTAIAAGLRQPGRMVGLHFFNPADRMRLVEVVRGDASDPSVVQSVTDLARAWGKTPVQCTSTPGFIVNRVARPYYGEAQRIADERLADPATIDAVLREAGGFPMGPFELTDLVGQDVNLAVTASVWRQTFHDARYAPALFQQRLVDAGRLGRKSGRGVFRYDNGTTLDAEPATEPQRSSPETLDWLVTQDGRTGFAVMTPFIGRVTGTVLNQVPASTPPGESPSGGSDQPGIALPDGALLRETCGRRATTEARDGRPMVLLDWAHDPGQCRRVALSASPDVSTVDLAAAIGLCQSTGAAVSVIGDSPGGVVARTVAMLINEAVELVLRGEATAQDVDVAMQLGTGYPSGPIAWGDRDGVDAATVVGHLREGLQSDRYRVSPGFDRARLLGRRLGEL